MPISDQERQEFAEAKKLIKSGDYRAAYRILKYSTHPLAPDYRQKLGCVDVW